MDGNTLQQLFSGTNPFLAQMGEKAFNLDQQKKQTDLANVINQEQRATSLHPYEIQAKQANIRQSDAAAGYSNTLADQLKEKLSVLNAIPLDQKVSEYVSKMKAGLAGDALKTTDAEMESLLGAASTAARNGGQLPLGYVLQNPKHAEYFKTPKGAQLAMQLARSYFEAKPAEMSKVAADQRDTARAVQTANIAANAAKERAALSGQRQQLRPPKTNVEASYYYQRLAETSESPEEAAAYMKKAQEAMAAHENELVQKAILAAQARLAGGIDMGQMGDVPVRPLPGQAPSRNQTPALPGGWKVEEIK